MLPIPGIGLVAMVFPSVIPDSPDSPVTEFTMRVPSSAGHGNRVSLDVLRRYLNQYAKYRAVLAASAVMGKTAINGHPVTRMIPESTLKGRSGAGGGGLVANPAGRYVKAYSVHELTALLGFDPKDRFHRRAAMRAWTGIAEDDVIDLQQEAGAYRIWGASHSGDPQPSSSPL